MCAAEGYFLLVDREMEAAASHAVANTGAEAAQELAALRAYRLLRCSERGTPSGSRCRHWRECLPEPNATCRPTLRTLEGFGDYYASECCATGYRGPLCEHCADGWIQSNGSCIPCKRTNWEVMLLACVVSTLLVFYVMKSSVATFEEASGTASIFCFFFQTASKLVQDRAPSILGFANYMNFNWFKPGGFGGEGSCTVNLKTGFYWQWLLSLVSMPCILLLVYLITILLTGLYSQKVKIARNVRLDVRKIRGARVIDHVLTRQPLFRTLNPKSRFIVASRMKLAVFEEGSNLIMQGDTVDRLTTGFYVITEGECAVKVKGLHVGDLHAGESFGELALLNDEPRTSTITALTDVEVGMLSGKEFLTILDEFDHEGKMKQQLDKMRAGMRGVSLSDATQQRDSWRSKLKEDGSHGGESSPSMSSSANLSGDEEAEARAAQALGALSDPAAATGASAGAGATFEQEAQPESSSTHRYSRSSTAERLVDQEYENLSNKVLQSHFNTVHYIANTDAATAAAITQTLTQIHIDDKCCGGCCLKFALALHKTTRLSLSTFFRACTDPAARYCGFLEILIYLYGPITQDLMIVFICHNSLFDDSVKVLVADPTVRCDGPSYAWISMIARIAWVLIAVGVPVFMHLASTRYWQRFDSMHLRKESEQMQRALFVSSWHTFDDERKEAAIQSGMHQLQIQEMSGDVFLLSKFQMSLTQSCVSWYQGWYMGRRLLLNMLYNYSQLDAVAGERTVSDWRVTSMLVLAMSTMLQYHFKPFRNRAENRLEMWSLQILTILLMVDYADFSEDGFFAIGFLTFSSILFVLLVLRSALQFYSRSKVAHRGWNALQRQHMKDAAEQRVATMASFQGDVEDTKLKLDLLAQQSSGGLLAPQRDDGAAEGQAAAHEDAVVNPAASGINGTGHGSPSGEADEL